MYFTKKDFCFSLKKTVMKMRPQVNGPIDVGYGNYLLTAPVDRQGRKRRRKKEQGGSKNSLEENDAKEKDSNMRKEKKLVMTGETTKSNGKYDVPELLSVANTLTNPNNSKHDTSKKSEL